MATEASRLATAADEGRAALENPLDIQEARELDEKAQRLIRKNLLISTGIELIPLPGIDVAALLGQQLYMLKSLGNLYGQGFCEDVGKKGVLTLIAAMAPQSTLWKFGVGSLLKSIPLVGQTLAVLTSPIIAGATTYALGEVFNLHFASGGTFLSFDPVKQRRHFQQLFEDGLRIARAERAAGSSRTSPALAGLPAPATRADVPATIGSGIVLGPVIQATATVTPPGTGLTTPEVVPTPIIVAPPTSEPVVAPVVVVPAAPEPAVIPEPVVAPVTPGPAVAAASATFASALPGQWVLDWGGSLYDTVLSAQGDRVTGTYAWQGGTLDGRVEGNVLRLRWDQLNNRRGGSGELVVAPDGTSLIGTWAYDPAVYNSGLTGSGPWVFRRKLTPAAILPAPEATVAPVVTVPDAPAPAPVVAPTPETAAPAVTAPEPPATPSAMVFDGQNSLVVLSPALPAMPAGVTVEFWARGADDLPRATSVFASWKDNGSRVLNIHLPWSDSSIYWDVVSEGVASGRIQKAAEPADYKGSWTHWAFVKDTAQGEMSIYRGGALWLKEAGKSGPIVESPHANIGAFVEGAYKWSGRLAEFRIWDKPRTPEETVADLSRRLTGKEPGLVGYWPLSRIDANGTTPDLAGNRPGAVQGATVAPDDALGAALRGAGAPPAAAPAAPLVRTGNFENWVGKVEGWGLSSGSGQRESVEHIKFPSRFGAPPQVAVALNYLDIIEVANSRVAVDAREIKEDGFDLVLSTWGDTNLHGAGAAWVAFDAAAQSVADRFAAWTGSPPDWKLAEGGGEREFPHHVAFPKPFEPAPRTLLGLTMLDVDLAANVRVRVEAKDVKPDGFDLLFKTWADTKLHGAGAAWVSLDAGRVKALTGEFTAAHEVTEGWTLIQGTGERSFVQHVAFSTRFDAPPQVIAWMSQLDAIRGANLRVRIEVRNLNAEGFDLSFKTWADTSLWSVGVNWLAIV